MSFTYTTLKNALQDYTQNTETSFVSNMPLFIRLGEERIFKSVQLNLFQRNVSGGMTADNQFLTVPSDFLAPISLSVTNSSNVEFLEFKSLEYIQAYNPNPATTGTPKYYAQFDLDNFTVAPTPDTGYVTTLSYFYRPTSITSSLFQLTLNNISGTFTTSDTITGGTSGQSSSVSAIDLSLGFLDVVVAATLTATIPSGTFTVGETITGSSSGATGTLSAIGADTTVTWLSENAEIALLYGCLLECYTYMKGEQDLISLYNSRLNEALSRLKNLGEAQEVSDEYTSGQIRKAKT